MLRLAIIVSTYLIGTTIAGLTPVNAQAFLQMGQQTEAGRLIEPPRGLLQQLREAERAIGQKRYSEAVVTLGDLLQRQPSIDDEDELSGQDFFLDPVNPTTGRGNAVRNTLVGEARRLLSSLPPAGIEIYELRYGPEARELMTSPAATRDWDAVAEVRRRFFHSEAGRDATALLVQRSISLGRPLQALRLLDALLTHPKLSVDAATGAEVQRLALLRAANRKAWVAEEKLADEDIFAADDDQAAPNPSNIQPTARTIELGGQKVTPPGFAPNKGTGKDRPTSEFDHWLAERFAKASTRRSNDAGESRMLGGNPRRSENSGGQMPLSIPRWMARTAATPAQQRNLDETAEAMATAGTVVPPSWMPLKVGNQILMRSTERLYGLDFRTGKLVWQYPWFDSVVEAKSTDQDAILMEEENGQTVLKQRVWNDLPYGRITSDGQRVFLLANLAEVEVMQFNALMGFQGTRPAASGSNSLVALDLATEGKLLWRIGGQDDSDDGWGEVFFLGPPLPLGDALYVMAEVSGDIMLICLDAATGLQRWRQQLLAVESGRVNNDAIRRIAGAVPSYHEGLLICSTGAGAIVAVDLVDQSLAWALLIDRNEALNQNMLSRSNNFSPDQLLQRWWDGTPRIDGDSIYVTPIESDRLFAIDLMTGEKRWKEIARTQFSSRYLAGIRDDQLILVGNDHIRAAATATGERTWETPTGWLDAGEQVSGVGTFGDFAKPGQDSRTSAYFVPTTANRIVAVSLADGTPLSYRDTQFPAGNLVAVSGQILSQSATTLSVAHGQMTLQPIVAAALEANPDDFQAVVRKAELLLQEGDLAESLEWLDRARQMDPDDVDVENLSVRAMLSALRNDFAGNQRLLPQLEQLIYWPADQVELIKLQVRTSLAANDSVDAIKRLIDLSQLISREPALASVGRGAHDDASRQVSLDGWLAARVYESMANATDKQATKINRMIGEYLSEYVGAATPMVKRLLVHFGSQAGGRPLTAKLMERYREDGAFLAMERLVLGATHATPETADRLESWQREALAEIYARGGLLPDAAAMLAAVDPEKDTGRLVESMVLSADEIAKLSAANQTKLWGTQVTVRLPQEMIRVRGSVIKPVVGKTRRVVGETFKGWQVVSDQSSPFAIRDPLGAVYPIPLDGMNRRDDMARQAVFSGGLMIAMLPNELIGVDLFQVMRGQIDSVIWRRPWRTDSSGGGIKPRSESTKFGDQIYRYVTSGAGGDVASTELVLGPIVGDTFYLLQGNELIACDAMTAEPRWRNVETPRGGVIVSDGNRVAVVSTNSKSIVQFDCRDGKRISETPLDDYQIWASTDETVLMYREINDTTRDLVLLDPINAKELLRHQYTDLSANNRVFGRVINGAHVVTLSAAGDVLVWDIQNAREISKLKIDPIESFKGLHVIPHHDSLVLLPNTSAKSEDRSSVAVQTNSGQDHVRVDDAIINISLADGKIAWKHLLDDGPWGCTITQSSVSPLLVLSRGKSRYLTTGSRTKTVDVQAIDFRNGKPVQTLDQPVESFSNDIETILAVQPTQQQVLVSIGNLRLEYLFSETFNKPGENADADDPADGGNQPQVKTAPELPREIEDLQDSPFGPPNPDS